MARLEIPINVDIYKIEELIDQLKHLQTYKLSAGDEMTLVDRDEVVEIIADHVKAEVSPLDQRWIPCSERLPDNNRQVLVYAMSVHFALAKYDEMREADGTYKMQWVTFDAWKPFCTIKEVIAWMPLPDPPSATAAGGEKDDGPD